MTSYPVYISDDDEIFISKDDIGHTTYWENEICLIISKKYGLDYSLLINRPYCQRRGRIVVDNCMFYCGEKISKKLMKKIKSCYGGELKLAFDDHEVRNSYDLVYFKGLKS